MYYPLPGYESTGTKTTRKMYAFKCDRCDKIIGTSEERENGYVPCPHGNYQVPVSFFFNANWYDTKYEHLCEACGKEYTKLVESTLKDTLALKVRGW